MKTLGTGLVLAQAILLVACNLSDDRQVPLAAERTYKSRVELGRAFEFRPRSLSTGGDIENHACIRGSYTHRYEITGTAGKEVWLCCIPVNEILSESFHCGDSVFSVLFGDADYMKIRYCSLQDPTSSEPKYIPVCVPAPLEAPRVDEPS